MMWRAGRNSLGGKWALSMGGYVGFVLLIGCGDPLREEAILALGNEVPGVIAGPLHRAGQPCLTCHDGDHATPLRVGGTIFLDNKSDKAAVSALVRLVDGTGHEHRTATNCAGNFFVRPGDFDPQWPLWVRVEFDGWIQEMESPVNVDGSCASCHGPEKHSQSTGPVFVYPFATEKKEMNCP